MWDEQNRIEKFKDLNTKNDLLYVLNASLIKYDYLIYEKKNLYTSFYIDKKNGAKRNILSPCFGLKKMQRDLNIILNANYDINKEIVHGFLKGNGIKSNALVHQNSNYILNIDLKDFFDTIHFGRVRGMFMKQPFNFPNYIATNLAKVTCYEKKLPQGSPTSPVISNIICYRLDREFDFLCKKYNCKYTRYADDITISTKMLHFPKEIAKYDGNQVILSKKITTLIEKEGFKINYEKLNLSSRANRQEVTGLIVNKKVNVKKVYLKNLRALLHNTLKYGLYLEGCKYLKNKNINFSNKTEVCKKFQNVLKGKIEFLKMIRGIDDRVYIKYAEMFNEIIGEERFVVDYGIPIKEFIENRTFPLVSYDDMIQGSCFFTEKYGFVTSTHVIVTPETFMNENEYSNLKAGESFRYNSKSIKPFYILDHKNIKKNVNPIITKQNIDSDIINCKSRLPKKYFKIRFDYIPSEEEKVYIAGYGEFKNYETTSINYIESKITGISEFLGRKICCINDKIYHGMSGGPVLNEKREVIGIVYAGLNLEGQEPGFISKNNGFILFNENDFQD